MCTILSNQFPQILRWMIEPGDFCCFQSRLLNQAYLVTPGWDVELCQLVCLSAAVSFFLLITYLFAPNTICLHIAYIAAYKIDCWNLKKISTKLGVDLNRRAKIQISTTYWSTSGTVWILALPYKLPPSLVKIFFRLHRLTYMPQFTVV